MKSIALAVASVFAIAPMAFAQSDGPYRERYARVVESTPVYSTASREECWNPSTGSFEERRDNRTDIGKGAAIGAIAGGVLGHQIDHGAGTAAGAILGGVLGHQIEKERDRRDDLDLSRCRMVADSSSAVEGYDVRYRYRGNEYVTRMAQDPGSRLLVGRDVNEDGTPLDQVASYSAPSYSYDSRSYDSRPYDSRPYDSRYR
jgi:uncharacterized protein YcfJ